MSLSHGPKLSLAGRRGGGGMTEQVILQRLEIEPLVEAVGEGAEVLVGVLAELEGLVDSVDHCL